jgi:hypothetical protein
LLRLAISSSRVFDSVVTAAADTAFSPGVLAGVLSNWKPTAVRAAVVDYSRAHLSPGRRNAPMSIVINVNQRNQPTIFRATTMTAKDWR